MTYQWTTDDDEIAADAIIVGIGGTSMEMLLAGLSYVEPTASIYWPEWFGPGGKVEAGGEMGPWLVPEALKRAEDGLAQTGTYIDSNGRRRPMPEGMRRSLEQALGAQPREGSNATEDDDGDL